jgi:anthranilate/para-aminobenzoate synthase component I
MTNEAVRSVGGLDRIRLLQLVRQPGSAMLEGWSDAGRMTIALPWPEEVRALSWGEIDEVDAFLGPILDVSQPSDVDSALPFVGGWVGFIAYEAGAEGERARRRDELPDEPAAWFARHESGIVAMPDGKTFVFGDAPDVDGIDRDAGHADMQEAFDSSVARQELDDSMGEGAYQAAVEEIRERIAWGDVYQVNLTRRFTAKAAIDRVGLYLAMTGDEPPRCSAYLQGDGWTIASASPEVFLRFDGATGRADSRPIKGTLRRTGDDEADRRALLASTKDEAEHLMIVDLVRNDLGKVAPPGAVRVAEYRGVRTLTHLLHLESIVEAVGLHSNDLHALVRALFPGGSITGAPKRAAVHAIREIEPCPRGVYTGAIGFVDRRGRAELSVAIRTAVITDGKCRYHAGGGIVWDSDPEDEDRESLAKSIAFLDALGVKTT